LPLKLLVKRSEAAERDYWQRQVEPLLGPHDEVLPELEHAAKIELLQRGRAFVFPIRWQEPFGLVMIEALACGLPVIATPRGAATEIVQDGETGYLRDNLDELAAAVHQSDRISPQACRQRVAQHFSAEVIVSPYERLFQQIPSHGTAAAERQRRRHGCCCSATGVA
jgi:glycosyltransferase involved in cell wall biosynthesis